MRKRIVRKAVSNRTTYPSPSPVVAFLCPCSGPRAFLGTTWPSLFGKHQSHRHLFPVPGDPLVAGSSAL